MEDKIIKGNDAQHLLDNKILKEAFSQIKDHLEDKALSVLTTDVKQCQDVVRAKQILASVERAIYSFIQDGKFEKAQLDAITKNKTHLFNRGF